jgi:MFS superfamily sulfate permease-like transporter
MFKISDLRNNLLSGLLVSFIALPLCLAIATASGFPVLSGLLTAIIGGLVVSHLSGSYITINGPAAGMIVVILDSVERLGGGDNILGYKMTLSAIVIASILQIITGFTKLPAMMRKFPEVIIRGMMVSIGLIVIIKQIFIVCSFKMPKHSILGLIADIPQALAGMQIETFIIGLSVMCFIIFWNRKIKSGFLSKIPVYLLVIVLASIAAFAFNISSHHHYLMQPFAQQSSNLFVSLPGSLLSAFQLPTFTNLLTLNFLLSVLTIFAVGSLETILSTIAADKLDPQKRSADLKKDLRAVGFGNFLCGMLGALPMIAEIVRSSANVKYGATNKWSNFFHGLFLLIFITLFASLIGYIPLCALGAMLILVGINLINIKLIKQMYKEWKPSLAVILSVVVFTLWIDLLVGILTGLVVYLLFKKIMNSK